jgi:spermidine synthase
MQRSIWKALLVVFISSFCVMVIELIAARILAPYIGVSLYTWTSIIGVILAGIALGNFIGGRIADKYPHPFVLTAIFLVGSLATISILPFVKLIAFAAWFNSLPLILSFMLKTACVFFLPAVILSMVSPLVIKMTLPDVGKTGGVVGTIYAVSTVGSILGTFMTGFYFILWFGTRSLVWMVAGLLILTGILSWFIWRVPERWKVAPLNMAVWIMVPVVLAGSTTFYQFPNSWQESYAKESNYYAIRVFNEDSGKRKVLVLDHLIHSYVYPDNPTLLDYGYEKTFTEIARYEMLMNPNPHVLHLGGGGYSFSRYMALNYPGSTNEVIEIDPEVTKIAYSDLGLPPNINIKTYNQDARLFFIQRQSNVKYDLVAGDVFNDLSTPYHLTTLEFARLVKANMSENGIYMINLIDDFQHGQYIPSFIYTLQQVFKHVSLFSSSENWDALGISTFVIAASDKYIDPLEYKTALQKQGITVFSAFPSYEVNLEKYLSEREPVLLTDDHVPTDILVAPLIGKR